MFKSIFGCFVSARCCSSRNVLCTIMKSTRMDTINFQPYGFWSVRAFSPCFRYLRKDNSEFENTIVKDEPDVTNTATKNNPNENHENCKDSLNQVKTHAERQKQKISKKRNQLMEKVQKYKELNQKISKVTEPPKKKKKKSRALLEAEANLRFLNNMDAHIIKHMNIKDTDIDEPPPSYVKTYEIGNNRRTDPRHLEERLFTSMKPKPKKIKKGETKEIRRTRKILDDDEKHLKPQKPRYL
ncbi:hypothetical protein FDP41_003933 [Naegleria fowleri]|uniref:Uncharacterized protein n=1 Tax=Naegleria fowleri TaxID=5763 RepID=A0A6A5BU45_NAEFO|nr:uncharacterized protein FDP41_003933 [Naegleria fowleri]KAF0977280.1 hypothetical protein FDP41_003933 [Naegleria fowleri]